MSLKANKVILHYLLQIVLLLVSFASIGCFHEEQLTFKIPRKEKIISFNSLESHIEVSLEKEGYLVFRCLIPPLNYPGANLNYIISNRVNAQGSKIYLTLLRNSDGRKPNEIEYQKHWPGINLIIPKSNFDLKKDKIFYKDQKGEYKIIVGTKKTWVRFLKNKFDFSINESQL